MPLKLISKHVSKAKFVSQIARIMNGMPVGEEEFEYNKEGQRDCRGGELLGKKKKIPKCLWEDYKMNIIGEKDDSPVYFCDKCDLPIQIYGPVIPCKYVFCYDCANLYDENEDKMHPGCSIPVVFIGEHIRGSVLMGSTVQGCKQTYLSEKALRAHINHHHKKAEKLNCAPPEKVDRHIASPTADIHAVFLDKDHMSHIPSEQHIVMSPPPVRHVLREDL
ncbi:hypothetical protein GH733_019268 [Mirounga leonina]|nr:hypothetical protein GH733_019268 [Mirounga leonina]